MIQINKQKMNKQVYETELSKLEYYLESTDYKTFKCFELGLSMKEKYPDIFAKRQEARDRINELRKIIGATE